MLLCKSLLITEYSGHVPPESWSFLGADWDTKASSSVSYFIMCFLGISELSISLAPFSKTGVAEYFLWCFLPLETKSPSMQSLPLLWRDHVKCNCSNSQNFWYCHGVLSAQQPFISHTYPNRLFTCAFS